MRLIALLACSLAALSLGAPNPDKLAERLALAIQNGEVKKVESLLKQGASPDRGYEFKLAQEVRAELTPLSNALKRRDPLPMVQLLLAQGANPNGADRVSAGAASWTTCPLNAAVHRGEAPLVKLLLAKGADPNGIPGASATPLYTAAWEAGMMYFSKTTGAARAIDAEIIDDLIAAGADVNRPVNGAAPIALERDAFLDGLQGNSQATFPKGATPLHAAAMLGTTRWVSYYLGKGANPNARNEYGMTPLHEAATRGRRYAIVKALIEAGADVNAKTVSGATPLHGVAIQTWPDARDVVKLLIASGASKSEKDASGRTPREIAVEAKNEELVGIL